MAPLRKVLSRILGPYLVVAAGWLGGAIGLEGQALATLEEALTVATVVALSGVAHKALDALGLNPADDARSRREADE